MHFSWIGLYFELWREDPDQGHDLGRLLTCWADCCVEVLKTAIKSVAFRIITIPNALTEIEGMVSDVV